MAKKEQQRNIMLIGAMVVAIGVTAWLLLGRGDDELLTIEDTIAPAPDVQVQQVGFVDVFQDENFLRLQDIPDPDLSLEPRGVNNPFEPFVIVGLPALDEDGLGQGIFGDQ